MINEILPRFSIHYIFIIVTWDTLRRNLIFMEWRQTYPCFLKRYLCKRELAHWLTKYSVFTLKQKTNIGFFSKWNGNSVNSANSGNLIIHWGMNVSCVLLVHHWILPQEVAGSNPFTVITNIIVNEFSEFNENI